MELHQLTLNFRPVLAKGIFKSYFKVLSKSDRKMTVKYLLDAWNYPMRLLRFHPGNFHFFYNNLWKLYETDVKIYCQGISKNTLFWTKINFKFLFFLISSWEGTH